MRVSLSHLESEVYRVGCTTGCALLPLIFAKNRDTGFQTVCQKRLRKCHLNIKSWENAESHEMKIFEYHYSMIV